MWKIANPKSMYISRGNHEAKSMNKMYGFEGEVSKKFSVQFYNFFSDLFQKVPISYLINQKVLVLHGGLFSKDGVKLDDI
jgi:serine/threonine-protein phosphatase 5